MSLPHFYRSRLSIAAARSPASVRLLARVALLTLLLVLAFLLRMYGIGWSLPYTDNVDEPAAVNRVFGMLRRDDWNPRFFGKPSLYYYALRLVFAAHLRYGVATGLYESIRSLPETTDRYVTTPQFFVWGRTLTAVLGTLTVVALYLLGRRWWNPWIGFIAAALLAVAPFHVRNSQYISQDVPMTLMTVVALLAALAPLRKPGWRAYALAGVGIGLAAATKYNVALVAVVLVVVHAQVWGRACLRQVGRLFWAAGWSLMVFVLATPYIMLTPGDFLNGLLRQFTAYNPNGSAFSGMSRTRAMNYLDFFWNEGLYPLPCLAALLGVGVVIARRDRAGIALLSFIVVYPLALMAQQVSFARNLLAVLPPLFIMSAIGIVAMAEYLLARMNRVAWLRAWQGSRSTLPVLTSGLVLLLLIAPARASIAQGQFYAQPYSKVRAAQYVKERLLPAGAPVAVALSPAQAPVDPFVITMKDVTDRSAAWYRAQGFRYLVANAQDTRRDRYASLRDAATVIQVFRGGDQAPGPVMEALDLGQHADQLAIERRAAEFGGQIRLLGFQRDVGDLRGRFTPLSGNTKIKAGQVLQLNAYWQSVTDMARDYAIFLHVLNAEGQKVVQRDTIIRGADYPTSGWVPGELVVDLADLPLPADLPAGKYQLILGVYNMASGQRLSVPGSADDTVPLLTFDLAAK